MSNYLDEANKELAKILTEIKAEVGENIDPDISVSVCIPETPHRISDKLDILNGSLKAGTGKFDIQIPDVRVKVCWQKKNGQYCTPDIGAWANGSKTSNFTSNDLPHIAWRIVHGEYFKAVMDGFKIVELKPNN